MNLLWALLWLFVLGCSQHLPKNTQTESHQNGHHKPGHVNDMYLDPDLNAKNKNYDFEASDRDVIVFKEAIVKHLPLKIGDIVADVGAGTGTFELLLSEKAGKRGKIYAIDIAPSFIPFMMERFKQEGLSNVEVVLGKQETTTLKNESVDLVLVVDTYHHFENSQIMLQDFLRILRPKSYLVIVDFDKTPDSREWIQNHISKTKQDYIHEIKAAGFDFMSEEKIPFKESFQLTFMKK
jgi:ubiquinone/menaquinone biosynthesis C-methylase UbiE